MFEVRQSEGIDEIIAAWWQNKTENNSATEQLFLLSCNWDVNNIIRQLCWSDYCIISVQRKHFLCRVIYSRGTPYSHMTKPITKSQLLGMARAVLYKICLWQTLLANTTPISYLFSLTRFHCRGKES